MIQKEYVVFIGNDACSFAQQKVAPISLCLISYLSQMRHFLGELFITQLQGTPTQRYNKTLKLLVILERTYSAFMKREKNCF